MIIFGEQLTIGIEAGQEAGVQGVTPTASGAVAAAFDSLIQAILPGAAVPEQTPDGAAPEGLRRAVNAPTSQDCGGNPRGPSRSLAPAIAPVLLPEARFEAFTGTAERETEENPDTGSGFSPSAQCAVTLPAVETVVPESDAPATAGSESETPTPAPQPDLPQSPALPIERIAPNVPVRENKTQIDEGAPPPPPGVVAAPAPAVVPTAPPATPPVMPAKDSAPAIVPAATSAPPAPAQRAPEDLKPSAPMPTRDEPPRSELAFAARLSDAPAPKPEQAERVPEARQEAIESKPAAKAQPPEDTVPTVPKPQAPGPDSTAPAPGQGVTQPSTVPQPVKPNPAPPAPAWTSVEAPQQPESVKAPVREFSVRITDPQARAADVRVVDRGGELHVAVRSGDPGLADSLRGDLSNLVSRIERSAVHAEIWRPESSPASGGGSGDSRGDSEGRSGFSHGQGQYQGEGRGHGDGRGHPRAPQWIEDLEEVPGRRQIRRETR